MSKVHELKIGCCCAIGAAGQCDFCVYQRSVKLREENAALRARIAELERERDEARDAKKRFLNAALIAFAGAGISTPDRGYGSQGEAFGHVFSDIKRALAQLAAEKERADAFRRHQIRRRRGVMDWISCKDKLPNEGEIVTTKIDDGIGVRNVKMLRRRGNLWFSADGLVRVYYTPTHWRQKEKGDE